MKNNIKRKHRILLTIVSGIAGVFAYFASGLYHGHAYQVCLFPETCFDVEVADTPEERHKGLMYRESMEKDDGMLFVFEISDIHNFRMKNTLIPLDMLWIDEDYVVVKILTAQPCTADPCAVYNPGIPAKYVLELNAGQAAAYGIAEGMKMRLININ